MSFLLYLVGFIVLIAGLGWVATMLGFSQVAILVGALVLLVVGVVTAFAHARSRDPVG